MLVPVGILAVLATVGGWIQSPPLWDPLTDWLAPVAPTLAVAEPTLDAGDRHVGRRRARSASPASRSRGRSTPSSGSRSRSCRAVQRVLEHKFYFDEAYDRIFYAPAVALADVPARASSRSPSMLQAGTDLGETTLDAGGLVRRLQTGLLRTYVFFLAAGAAVLVLAFLIAK